MTLYIILRRISGDVIDTWRGSSGRMLLDRVTLVYFNGLIVLPVIEKRIVG